MSVIKPGGGYYMVQWVSSRGATISGLCDGGHLWVVDQLPPPGARHIETWETVAAEKDTVLKLMGRWVEGRIPPLPHNSQVRQRMFVEAVRYGMPVALVIYDAQCLRKALLRSMRVLSEVAAPVILVGDVLKIGAAIMDDNACMQRAGFCVGPVELFLPGKET